QSVGHAERIEHGYGWQRLAQESVALASGGDGESVVRGKRGGDGGVECGGGCVGGVRQVRKLLQGGIADAGGIEVMYGLRRDCGWRLGWICGDSRGAQTGEDERLTGRGERQGVGSLDELHILDGLVDNFRDERVIGYGSEHGLGAGEGGLLILEVELGIDLRRVRLVEKRLGGRVGGDVERGGLHYGLP